MIDRVASTGGSEARWKCVPLGELLVEIRNGLTAPQEKEPPGIPVTRIETISKGVVDMERVRYVREPAPAKLDRFWLKSGDILFSHINSDLHLGKTAVVASDAPLLHGTNLLLLRPDSQRLSSRFLHHWLDFCRRSGRFMAIAQHAVNQSSLNQKKITSLTIPLPPLPEQHSIVAEIEKQFSRLDEAVANLKRVKANLKRYKASVLKAAVDGRLVPSEAELARLEGRRYETGVQLLQCILETRRSQWKGKGKYKEPGAPNTADLPELPEGWAWIGLDQLTSKITSGSRDWSPFYGRGRSIFVLAQNVRSLVPDFSVQQFVDPPRDDPSCERSRIQDGDLLATIVGANTGQVCYVRRSPGDAYVCQSVALIRPALIDTAVYVNYWLNSDEHGQRYFDRCMYGQGRPHLSFEQLMATPIALPPLAEQHRIVAEVDRRLSLAREVEAEVDTNLARSVLLRSSVLCASFAGTECKGIE